MLQMVTRREFSIRCTHNFSILVLLRTVSFAAHELDIGQASLAFLSLLSCHTHNLFYLCLLCTVFSTHTQCAALNIPYP